MLALRQNSTTLTITAISLILVGFWSMQIDICVYLHIILSNNENRVYFRIRIYLIFKKCNESR